jgi:glutaminyl-peptide cyclotransferase
MQLLSPRRRLAALAAALLAALTPPLAGAYTPLSDSFLRAIPSGADALDPATGALLAPLLTPRVPGTPEHARVQDHLASFFRNELPRWDVEWQNSSATTPVSGDKAVPFRNLVVRREPPWVAPGQSNLLTLVAHYDSKLKPDGFIGATDSAVPCAVLMHVARELDARLTRMHGEMDALGEGGTTEMDMGVQILFLDGEEAFVRWTATDSLYGSRWVLFCGSGDPVPPVCGSSVG